MTVVTQQPVVVQKPVFRDYPVVITLDNGQQVRCTLLVLAKLFIITMTLFNSDCCHVYSLVAFAVLMSELCLSLIKVQTRIEYRTGVLTWLVCALLCFFLFELGFCWIGLIAFCINPLKDVYHLDPNGNVVGIYKRI